MFGMPFFISQAISLGLIQVSDLKGKSHSTAMLTAFQEHFDDLKNKGFKVKNVYTDGESSINTISYTIKKFAACNRLPYTIPSSLLGHLLSYVVRCINIIPSQHSEDKLSAREKYLGRKTDVKKDLRIEFGSYVQAKTPNSIINGMEDRTEGCIALMPLDTDTGTVRFLNLTTLREVNRDQWIELPIPDIVLARINEMAMEQSRKLSKDPRFIKGIDGDCEYTYNDIDDNRDTPYAEELMNIRYSENYNNHNYSLRQHRSNWSNKVTAISTIKAQQYKYVYHTSISHTTSRQDPSIFLELKHPKLEIRSEALE